MQYRETERLECQFQCSAYISFLINSSFVCWICSFSLFIMKLNNKSYKVHFLMQKRIAVEHEKHEDWLYKKGKAHDNYIAWMMIVQSFNIIVWPRPFLKWLNLKYHAGVTYDPLWPISTLNTAGHKSQPAGIIIRAYTGIHLWCNLLQDQKHIILLWQEITGTLFSMGI